MEPIRTPDDLGKLIRKARKHLQLSQNHLAGMTGKAHEFVNHAENGKSECQIGKVLELARELGIELYALTPAERTVLLLSGDRKAGEAP